MSEIDFKNITLSKSTYMNARTEQLTIKGIKINLCVLLFSDTILITLTTPSYEKLANFYYFDYRNYNQEKSDLEEICEFVNEDDNDLEDDLSKLKLSEESSKIIPDEYIRILLGEKNNESLNLFVKMLCSKIVYSLNLFNKKSKIKKLLMSFSLFDEFSKKKLFDIGNLLSIDNFTEVKLLIDFVIDCLDKKIFNI